MSDATPAWGIAHPLDSKNTRPDRTDPPQGSCNIKVLSSPEVLSRLYTFLDSGTFLREKARSLPICLGKDQSLHSASQMVLPGEVKDSFGCVNELDHAHAEKFQTFFAKLGLKPLNGDAYYMRQLPELATRRQDLRGDILEHLAVTHHLTQDRKASWRGVPIVRTVQGDWVKPPDANFAHPLLDQLFKSTYHAVAEELAKNSAIYKLLIDLGVESTPTPEKLAAIVEERKTEAVTPESLAWRRELINHALQEPAVLEQLKPMTWLPNAAQSRWKSAPQLWHPRFLELVGQEREPEHEFIGLELTADEATRLGLSEPKVDTVLRHLDELERKKQALPPSVLAWLEGQALDGAQVKRLQQLPLFLGLDGKYFPAQHFFLGEHFLAPYRGLLSGEYGKKYPQLIRMLKIREKPIAEDYVAVLEERAQAIPDGGKASKEIITLFKRSLAECAKEWKSKEPDPEWLIKLRFLRVIPVGTAEETRLLRPKDALRLNLPEIHLKRYELEDAEAYLCRDFGNSGFLKSLGVYGLKERMQKRLLSHASEGTTSGYNRKLREVLPAVVRYVHHLRSDKTPEEIESKLDSSTFVALRKIEAELSFPNFTLLKTRRIQLEYEVENQSILLLQSANKFIPGVALAEALNLDDAPLLSLLLSLSLIEGEELLDAHEIAALPIPFISTLPFQQAEAVHPVDLPTVEKVTNVTEPNKSTHSGEVSPSIPYTSSRLNASSVSSPQEKPKGQSSSQVSNAGTNPKRSRVSSSPLPPRTDQPAPPVRSLTNQQVREQAQHSATNAASWRDHHPQGVGKSFSGTKSQGARKVSDSRVRRAQTRFRNYVHVIPEQASAYGEHVSQHNKRVDRIGMNVVQQFETLAGRTPVDYSDEPEGGFDIRSDGPDGVRFIEVKTLSGAWGTRGVTVSRKQMSTAFGRHDRFWLYVVECADSQPRLWCIRNPAWLANSYTFADDWADERFAEGPYTLGE